jgi:hypothetical protein
MRKRPLAIETRMRIGQDCGRVFIVPKRDSGVVHVRNDVDVPQDAMMRRIPYLTFLYVWEETGHLNWSALLQDGRTCFLTGAMWDSRTQDIRAEEALSPEHVETAREYLTANWEAISSEVSTAFRAWTAVRQEEEKSTPTLRKLN